MHPSEYIYKQNFPSLNYGSNIKTSYTTMKRINPSVLSIVLTSYILNILNSEIEGYIVNELYHRTLSSCNLTENGFEPNVTLTLGECAMLCTKSTNCGVFVTRREECGMLRVCPRCCSASDEGDSGWNVYCPNGRLTINIVTDYNFNKA